MNTKTSIFVASIACYLHLVVLVQSVCCAFVNLRNVGDNCVRVPKEPIRKSAPKVPFLYLQSIKDDVETKNLEVVLIGVGDLRVDDHGGFASAMEISKNGSKVLPIVVLTDDLIRNIPCIMAHSVDTTAMISSALKDIDDALRYIQPDLRLHCMQGPNFLQAMNEFILEISDTFDNIKIHVCDLGDVDNQMSYGPFSQISKVLSGDQSLEIVSWCQHLRDAPRREIESLNEDYPSYQKQYTTAKNYPIAPVSVRDFKIETDRIFSLPKHQGIPSNDHLLETFFRSIKATNIDAEWTESISVRAKAERCTGLYMSHWGGLPADTVKTSKVIQSLKSYVIDCKENDKEWFDHPEFITSQSNKRSLEHAAMKWQLEVNLATGKPKNADNWLEGEAMIRYLAAPLLLGTVSPRRVWHISNKNSGRRGLIESAFPTLSPLKQMVEGSEWHRLLASKTIRLGTNSLIGHDVSYEYWRYQGFLCRYAMTKFADGNERDKTGLLLVHGFGASGAQWNKAMQEINILQNDGKVEKTVLSKGLAPDLIGFGQSEKPSISYTGYLWDSQMMDFCKEIAIKKYNLKGFVTGGNSIGGFTSLSLAASDSASVDGMELSSSGAPGTQKCIGLVLMNSAGPIISKEEDERERSTVQSDLSGTFSVAQVTALGKLPPCTPPARPIARLFGVILLAYLRPRIQSICKNLYPTNPKAVDDELCSSILRDSLDPGAIFVMMAGAKLPKPRTANELLAADFGNDSATTNQNESAFRGPVLVAQGVLDPLNDASDRLNRFTALRSDITGDPIQAGHCPHDELPGEVAKSIFKWMSNDSFPRRSLKVTSSQASVSGGSFGN